VALAMVALHIMQGPKADTGFC